MPLLMLTHTLHEQANLFRLRLKSNQLRILALDSQLRAGGPTVWQDGAYQVDRTGTIGFLEGDTEHLLSLINRVGEAFNALVAKNPQHDRLVTFERRRHAWFRIVNDLRNDIEHVVREVVRGNRSAVLGYDASRLYYATAGARNAGRQVELIPQLVEEFDNIWEEFLQALES